MSALGPGDRTCPGINATALLLGLSALHVIPGQQSLTDRHSNLGEICRSADPVFARPHSPRPRRPKCQSFGLGFFSMHLHPALEPSTATQPASTLLQLL